MNIFSHFPNLYHDKSVQKSTYFPLVTNKQFTFPFYNSRTDMTRYHIFRGIRFSPPKGVSPSEYVLFHFCQINMKNNKVRTSSGHILVLLCEHRAHVLPDSQAFICTPFSLFFILKLVKNRKIHYSIGRDVKT